MMGVYLSWNMIEYELRIQTEHYGAISNDFIWRGSLNKMFVAQL